MVMSVRSLSRSTTNAGGALLNVELGRAQRACCDEVRNLVTGPIDVAALEDRLYGMFLEEWRLARGQIPLERIAVVDDAPAEQYLFPEFLLLQRLFEARGVHAVVADPAQLEWRDGVLGHGGGPVDVVYNRLTDFYFGRPQHAALRAAYLSGAAVVTPDPRVHALYANKRNLALLTDEERVRSRGLSQQKIATLSSVIPRTRPVVPTDAERLWSERKTLSFKPTSGFGSRGSYRGDKLTRKGLRGDPRGRLRRASAGTSQRALPAGRGHSSCVEDGSAQLRLRWSGTVGRCAPVPGADHQLPHPGGGFAPVFYPRG
jgi:hypothetical protein